MITNQKTKWNQVKISDEIIKQVIDGWAKDNIDDKFKKLFTVFPNENTPWLYVKAYLLNSLQIFSTQTSDTEKYYELRLTPSPLNYSQIICSFTAMRFESAEVVLKFNFKHLMDYGFKANLFNVKGIPQCESSQQFCET